MNPASGLGQRDEAWGSTPHGTPPHGVFIKNTTPPEREVLFYTLKSSRKMAMSGDNAISPLSECGPGVSLRTRSGPFLCPKGGFLFIGVVTVLLTY